MELTFPRMDRLVAKRQVDKIENKSFESTSIHSLTSVSSSSSMASTRTFPSSIASPAAKVSADVTDLTGLCDLRELQESVVLLKDFQCIYLIVKSCTVGFGARRCSQMD